MQLNDHDELQQSHEHQMSLCEVNQTKKRQSRFLCGKLWLSWIQPYLKIIQYMDWYILWNKYTILDKSVVLKYEIYLYEAYKLVERWSSQGLFTILCRIQINLTFQDCNNFVFIPQNNPPWFTVKKAKYTIIWKANKYHIISTVLKSRGKLDTSDTHIQDRPHSCLGTGGGVNKNVDI